MGCQGKAGSPATAIVAFPQQDGCAGACSFAFPHASGQ